MPTPHAPPLIAVDIGNSRMKIGWFEAAPTDGAPEPARTWEQKTSGDDFAAMESWLQAAAAHEARWCIGSVNRPAAGRLLAWLTPRIETSAVTLLTAGDLPLLVELPEPEKVGVDRLLGAVAANRLRAAERAAVVVDLGTAITVDLLSSEGVFLGGAILPGIGMSTRAFHEFTDLLPRIDFEHLDHPPGVLGKSTVEAMTAGLYWGAVGGVRAVIERFRPLVGGDPQIFLTGGAAPAVAGLISPETVHAPHLVLAGIAITARG